MGDYRGTGEDSSDAYKLREKDKDRGNELVLHKSIYDQFRNNRLDNDIRRIEKSREALEERLIKTLRAKIPATAPSSIRQMEANLDTVKPLVIVDVPVKGTKRGTEASSGLCYLTEDTLGVHGGVRRVPLPKFEVTKIILDDEAFDKHVGKIRVFAHPEFRDLIVSYLSRRDILAALQP